MTNQVIAFTKRIEFKTLLDIECKELTGFFPVVKDCLEELKSFLDLFPEIYLLIFDNPPGSSDLKHFMSTLRDREGSIKNMVFIYNEKIDLINAKTFTDDKTDHFMGHLKSLLGNGSIPDSGYIAVPADSLIHFKTLPFDLYIKISENKYLKRIPANEEVDEGNVVAFREKGITELHFERKYNRDFSLMLLNNMINKVEGDYSSVDAKLKALNEVFLTTKEIVQSVGLLPRVIQVCQSVMDSIAEDASKEKDKFSRHLSQISKQSNLNFQFRFVELTSFIATQMVDDMNAPAKDEQIRKVVFASFFCDFTLTSVDQLQLRRQGAIKDLWHEDKKTVEEHALMASRIVAKYKNAPLDADVIIRQHHGSLDGVGLHKFPGDILPLSLILMASQELALAILREPEVSPKKLISSLTKSFEGSALHEYLLRFEKSCLTN
jgi:hypothetical protein